MAQPRIRELKSALSIKWKELQSPITKGMDRKRVKIWGQECLLWVVSFECLDPAEPESDSPRESTDLSALFIPGQSPYFA